MSKTFASGADSNREKKLAHLPTIEYFQKTYGKTMEGSDQKAAGVFKDFESQEKLRRFQNELSWVKDGKVSGAACDRVIGKKRKSKYDGYEKWAQLMLLWLAQSRK
jgi:hypothetical protein